MQAITANDLHSGEPVFRAGAGWALRLADADLFAEGSDAEAALASAAAPTVVVEPYLIDLVVQDGAAIPVSYRERIRALGPTTHLSMGKQARGGEDVAALQAAKSFGRSEGRLGLIRKKK